ncbi:DUF4097 family beta strand repeat-containing protein [Nocardioides kribbensis]|uniref:DUF4097 family beta strand repeat-containing protein n=1 Tax=Nocardioides kribbensis TaxID=305517 RepID=UPI0032DA97CC
MSSTREHRLDVDGPVDLVVRNPRGVVTVTAVTATPAAAGDAEPVTVSVTGPAPDTVDVRSEDGRVEVAAPTGRSAEGHYHLTIRVPAGSRLTARLGSSELSAVGPLATATVQGASGDVTVEDLAGASRVETGSGDVRLPRCADVTVQSGSGDVELGRVGGAAQVSTGSGDVTVEACTHELVVKTGSGDLHVGSLQGALSFSTASGDLTVERAEHGSVSARSASGDVHVGVPAGLPTWTDVGSVSGEVASELDAVGEPAPGQDHLLVRATTVSGDVRLSRR